MLLMDDLTQEQKVTNDGLYCSEYTAEMLIGFLNSKLPNQTIEQVV
jgi:hypothetical protein